MDCPTTLAVGSALIWVRLSSLEEMYEGRRGADADAGAEGAVAAEFGDYGGDGGEDYVSESAGSWEVMQLLRFQAESNSSALGREVS